MKIDETSTCMKECYVVMVVLLNLATIFGGSGDDGGNGGFNETVVVSMRR